MTNDNYLFDTNIIKKLLLADNPKNKEICEWFIRFLSLNQKSLYLPEIVSYEIRRGLQEVKLKDPKSKRLDKFEKFAKQLIFLPINSQVFKIAEVLWAEARKNGYPTASRDALDGDVLLAAQAIAIDGIVITENTKHLEKYVRTYHWKKL